MTVHRIGFSIVAMMMMGCYDKVGTQGRLSMEYSHGFLEQTSTPLATGLTANVAVRSVNTNSTIRLVDVLSSDISVFRIDTVDGDEFQITANQQGEATIHVSSDAGDDSFTCQLATWLVRRCLALSAGC